MLAVCYEKSDKKMVVRQGRRTFHQLVDGSEEAELIPELHVKFTPVPMKDDVDDVFQDPSFMPGGPSPRRGIARVAGTVGIEQAAEEIGMEPDELVFWMLNAPRYDTATGFVIIRDDGRKILDLEDWVIDAPNGYEDKARFCRACRKELDVRGAKTHTTGQEHKAAFADYKEQLKQKITLLGRARKASDTVAYL